VTEKILGSAAPVIDSDVDTGIRANDITGYISVKEENPDYEVLTKQLQCPISAW